MYWYLYLSLMRMCDNINFPCLPANVYLAKLLGISIKRAARHNSPRGNEWATFINLYRYTLNIMRLGFPIAINPCWTEKQQRYMFVVGGTPFFILRSILLTSMYSSTHERMVQIKQLLTR